MDESTESELERAYRASLRMHQLLRFERVNRPEDFWAYAGGRLYAGEKGLRNFLRDFGQGMDAEPQPS